MLAFALCAASLSSCDKQPAQSDGHSGAASADQEQAPAAASIAQDLAAGNYDAAAKAAELAVAANPGDAELHLLQARAQARLQNVGAAVAALRASFDAGFHDPRGALNNPDFDGIRANPIFAKFASQFARKSKAAPSESRSGPTSSITAGDVSIIENSDGSSRIRAGDIELRD
jgi:hypothetical protein